MSHKKWEQICRCCGRCCYEKIDVEGTIYYTSVPCEFLDRNTQKCTVYKKRHMYRPDCIPLDPESVAKGYLPADCPYTEGIKGYPAPVLDDDQDGSD